MHSGKVNPDDGFFISDPELGICHKPGTHKIEGADYSFISSHGNDSLRLTQRINGHKTNGAHEHKDEVWVFGCSYTHGWALNDEETYPWLLQERLPDYRVVNFGTSGYSTVQSLCQLRRALNTRKKPKFVIMAYCDSHDPRNTFARSWKKVFKPYVNGLDNPRFPSGRVDRDGLLKISDVPVNYSPFPLMKKSALVHVIEDGYNWLEEKKLNSHLVSRAAMEELMKACDEFGVKLIVSGLVDSQETKNMLVYCKREGISVVDLSVNFQEPLQARMQQGTFPDAETNKYYADRLANFIDGYDYKVQKKKSKRARMKNMKKNKPKVEVPSSAIGNN